MRGFARLVAGGRAAVANAAASSSSSSGAGSSSSLLPSRRLAGRPSSFSARSFASSPSLLAASRKYATTNSTSLIDELEDDLGEAPKPTAAVVREDKAAAAAASTAKPSQDGQPATQQKRETRAEIQKRLDAQEFSPEMWTVGEHRSRELRRRQVAQEGKPDECKWKTDPFTQSIWKLNRVAKLIRRMPVNEALIQLKFSEKASAIRLYKSLEDGKRRAIEKGLAEDKLIVHEAYTEKATTIKRRVIMGRGRSGLALKRASRVYFVLKEAPSLEAKEEYRHRRWLRKITQKGPNVSFAINRRKAKIEGASESAWRW